MNENIQDRINAFVAYANQLSIEHWNEQHFTYSNPPRRRADYLSEKWCRILVQEERQGLYVDTSVYAFICLKDNQTKALGVLKAGDIHKAATFKAPAKHARGNVFFPDFGKCCTPYGIVYLTGDMSPGK